MKEFIIRSIGDEWFIGKGQKDEPVRPYRNPEAVRALVKAHPFLGQPVILCAEIEFSDTEHYYAPPKIGQIQFHLTGGKTFKLYFDDVSITRSGEPEENRWSYTARHLDLDRMVEAALVNDTSILLSAPASWEEVEPTDLMDVTLHAWKDDSVIPRGRFYLNELRILESGDVYRELVKHDTTALNLFSTGTKVIPFVPSV